MTDLLDEINSEIIAKEQTYSFVNKLITGDMWADGDGWIGPTINQSETQILNLIKKEFTYTNLLTEVISRHVHSITFKHPSLITNDATLQTLLAKDEDKDDDETWYELSEANKVYEKALKHAQWSGSSVIRAFVPRQATNELDDGTVVVKEFPFEELIYKLKLSAPNPLTSGIIKDADNVEICGYYQYKEKIIGNDSKVINNTVLEIVGVKSAMMPYGLPEEVLNEDDDATLVIIFEGMGGDTQRYKTHAAYPLGGYSLITEVETNVLIDSGVISRQLQHNLASTMTTHNVINDGFRERIIMNAMRPGYWIDENGNTLSGYQAGARFSFTKMLKGAGVDNMLMGAPLMDNGALKGYTNPSVHESQPVNPQTTLLTQDNAEYMLYKAVKQLHALTGNQLALSGEARTRAMDDFRVSLASSIHAYEYSLQNGLSSFFRLCMFLASDGQELPDLVIKAKAKPYFGASEEMGEVQNELSAV